MNSKILDLIIKHGISIRQLPLKNVENWLLNTDKCVQRYKNNGYTIKWSEGREMKEEIFKKNFVNDYFSPELVKYEDGKIYRTVAHKETILQDGGFWMCKPCSHSDSVVKWNKKTDNLANTLEESVLKCVSKIKL